MRLLLSSRRFLAFHSSFCTYGNGRVLNNGLDLIDSTELLDLLVVAPPPSNTPIALLIKNLDPVHNVAAAAVERNWLEHGQW